MIANQHSHQPKLTLNHDDLRYEKLSLQNGFRQTLPAELGQGSSVSYLLEPQLTYIDTQFQPNRDLSLLSKTDFVEPRIVVTLALEGQSQFINRAGNQVLFSKGYTTISHFVSSVGSREYQAHQSVKQIRFSIGEAWLARYFGEAEAERVFAKTASSFVNSQPTTTQALLQVQQLTADRVGLAFQPMLIHGLALSVLAYELDHFWQHAQLVRAKFSPQDQKLAEQAKHILTQNHTHPPELEQLAQMLAVSPFRLKKLFLHFFNTTPYGWVLELRMTQAYQLLENTQQTISQVAASVGYQHASNFSSAFSQYFGVSPKQVAKIKTDKASDSL